MAGLSILTRQLAAKAESSPGTIETLSAADATEKVYYDDADFIKDNTNYAKRPLEGGSSKSRGSMLDRPGESNFMYLLHSSGTASTAPTFSNVIFKSAGMSFTTGTYAPTSASTSVCTIGGYQSGWRKYLVGAASNLVFHGEGGKPVEVRVNAMGKIVTPATATILSPTKHVIVPPRWAGSSTSTLGASNYHMASFDFDMGNQLTLIEDGTLASDASGYAYGFIPDRDPKLTLSIMDQTGHDFFADFAAETTMAGVITVGSSAGNIVTFNFASLQLTEPPRVVDKDKKQMVDLVLQPNASGSTIDSDYSIVIS